MSLPPQFEPPSPFTWTGFLIPLPFSILALLEFTLSKLPEWYLAWCYSTGFSPLVDLTSLWKALSSCMLLHYLLSHFSAAISSHVLLPTSWCGCPPFLSPAGHALSFVSLHTHTAFFWFVFFPCSFSSISHTKSVWKKYHLCETTKETQMYRTVFWTLWEREGEMIGENGIETCIISCKK